MPDEVVYTGDVLAISLKNNALRTYEDDESKPTRRQKPVHPRFDFRHTDVEPWRDDTGLVDAPIQLYDDFT